MLGSGFVRTPGPLGIKTTYWDSRMDSLATVVSILYQFATNGAFLLLSALGLIVILGMMNIINLAHGELMMMGAYTASIAWHRGVPFWLCAILAFLVVALFGAIL